MRVARFTLFFLVIIVIPVWSKQPLPPQQTQTGTAQPTAPKDPQAVSVVNQALNAVGGTVAITGIADFTETGSVTYYSGPDPSTQGTVTIRAKGFDEFRIDTNLPPGTRSESIDARTTMKYEDGTIQELPSQPPLYPVRIALPVLHLRAALTSPGLSLTYKGTITVNGNPAYDVQVQRTLSARMDPNSPLTRYLTIDYFIDASTSEVVMMQDTVAKGSVRQLQYSNFTPVNGITVPFSVSEVIQGQTLRVFQLNQVAFNSGLQDSDFQL